MAPLDTPIGKHLLPSFQEMVHCTYIFLIDSIIAPDRVPSYRKWYDSRASRNAVHVVGYSSSVLGGKISRISVLHTGAHAFRSLNSHIHAVPRGRVCKTLDSIKRRQISSHPQGSYRSFQTSFPPLSTCLFLLRHVDVSYLSGSIICHNVPVHSHSWR